MEKRGPVDWVAFYCLVMSSADAARTISNSKIFSNSSTFLHSSAITFGCIPIIAIIDQSFQSSAVRALTSGKSGNEALGVGSYQNVAQHQSSDVKETFFGQASC